MHCQVHEQKNRQTDSWTDRQYFCISVCLSMYTFMHPSVRPFTDLLVPLYLCFLACCLIKLIHRYLTQIRVLEGFLSYSTDHYSLFGLNNEMGEVGCSHNAESDIGFEGKNFGGSLI